MSDPKRKEAFEVLDFAIEEGDPRELKNAASEADRAVTTEGVGVSREEAALLARANRDLGRSK